MDFNCVSAIILDLASMLQGLFAPMTDAERLSYSPFLIFGVINLCLASISLTLWRVAPDHKVLRSIGLFMLVVSFVPMLVSMGGVNWIWPFSVFASPLLFTVAQDAMRFRFRRWGKILWGLSFAVIVFAWPSNLSFLRNWPTYLSQILLAVMVVRTWRRGTKGDREMAGLFVVIFLVRWLVVPHPSYYIMLGGWRWSPSNATVTTLGAITVGFFIRDLIRDRRDKLRMAAELEAARAVQLVLVPEQIPAVPGFALEAVYRPFSQVGGDFFQILPLPGNSVLAAVGDVSGKGVPAAMTVSHLVGILRFAAEASSSPKKILAALNRSLCDRGGQGFTTCLVLRCNHDGTLTFANAGHIAPFLNGKEISIENSLPLGIACSSIYPETTVSLPPNAQLTLLSDGVIEAQNAKGELFGFDRTAAISTQTAESIASTAQAFGQKDDITVVTLSLTAPHLSLKARSSG
jgi:hypothetical protein